MRSTLQLLLDDSKPIEERLDHVVGTIKGFGQATLTAVLHVVFPDKYGVCNNTSENGLSNLGIYPEFDRGEQFGSRYSKINSILVLLAKSLNVDLWTLDAVWWALLQDEAVPLDATADERRFAVVDPNASPVPAPHVFGLERHLHLFLVHNWKHLAPMNEWNIYSTNEKEDAGYEYICHVGKIDILARHKTAKKWLVIELKRNETSDEVVGQALRYMGWVKKHLAEPGDLVQGLIIAHKGDDPLQYAVSAVPNLEFQIYEVDFHLKPPPEVSK